MSLEDRIGFFTDRDKISYIKRLEIQDTMKVFANEHHRSAKGSQLEFDGFNHMIELYEEGALHQDLVILAGTQIGKTDWLVIFALACAYNGLNVFYVLPKADMRDNYVQSQFLSRIHASQFYTAVMREGVAKSVEQIHFGKGIIRFVGANSEADMASFPADVLIGDEIDDISTPANLDIAQGRLGDSDHKLRRFVSNPTKQKGLISIWYELSNKKVRKFPCKKCKQLCEIDWFENVIKQVEDDEGNTVSHILRDRDYVPGGYKDIQAKCSHKINGVRCDGDIDKYSDAAVWEATAVSEQGIVGYKMPRYISKKCDIREVYKKYIQAIGNPSKMRALFKTDLAIPFAESGNKVSETTLDRCVEKEYIFELHSDCAYANFSTNRECYMGVDIASDHFDISISHQDDKHKTQQRLIYIGKICPNQGIGFLHDLVERYNVQCCVVDIQPETLPVKEFQNSAKCIVWRCKFANKSTADEIFNEKNGVHTLVRCEMLDRAYTELRTRNIIFPENYEHILEGVYQKEMLALSRVQVETKTGYDNKWIGPSENHAFLTNGYRNIAVDLMLGDTLFGEDCFYS